MVWNIVLSDKVLCFSVEMFAELFWRKLLCGGSNLFSVTCGYGTSWNNKVERCCIIILNPDGTWCDWTVWSSRSVHILPVAKYSYRSREYLEVRLGISWSVSGASCGWYSVTKYLFIIAWKVQSLEFVWLVLFNNRPFS